MELGAIYDLFQQLGKDHLSFLYHGFMSDEFTDKIISLSEQNIEKLQDTKTAKNRVSFLIAESFQNIVRHGESIDETYYSFNKPGVFIYRIKGSSYFIVSANLIKNKNIDEVAQKLSKVNQLSAEQLRELYLSVIDNPQHSEKGGAGLGLIEMARKTGHRLEYEFEKIDDTISCFYLSLTFQSKTNEAEQAMILSMQESKNFYQFLKETNTYLAYKGDFSQENVLILLKIIERNLKINTFEHESIKSLIYLLLTELLQNISKHAFQVNNKVEGIFLIGRYINKYVISTGNYVQNSEIAGFETSVRLLNGKNTEELQKLYIEKLKNGHIDEAGNAGLGLIEMVKEVGKINYEVQAVNENYSFLTISLSI